MRESDPRKRGFSVTDIRLSDLRRTVASRLRYRDADDAARSRAFQKLRAGAHRRTGRHDIVDKDHGTPRKRDALLRAEGIGGIPVPLRRIETLLHPAVFQTEKQRIVPDPRFARDRQRKLSPLIESVTALGARTPRRVCDYRTVGRTAPFGKLRKYPRRELPRRKVKGPSVKAMLEPHDEAVGGAPASGAVERELHEPAAPVLRHIFAGTAAERRRKSAVNADLALLALEFRTADRTENAFLFPELYRFKADGTFEHAKEIFKYGIHLSLSLRASPV